MRRRALLATVGGALAGIAGCLADDTGNGTDEPDGDGSPTATPQNPGGAPETDTSTSDPAPATDTRTPSPEPKPPASPSTPSATDSPGDGGPARVVSTDMVTTETGCTSGTDDIEVTFDDDGVSIDGVATAPTPCYAARIASASVADGTLRVELDLVSTDDICVQCLGAISYTARIDLSSANAVDTVAVHNPEGATVTVSHDEATGTPHPVPRTGTDSPGTPHAPEPEPDADLPIYVENHDDAVHELTVTVTRESGETVFDEHLRLEPGTDREAYNLAAADPDGIEPFTVTAAADGATTAVTVRTDDCHGSVIVWVSEAGEVDLTYSIC